MKIKRLLALLIATAMTVGMIPSLVFARELDYEPEEQEVSESSEPAKEEETKPQVKETTKPQDEEPADTKEEEPKTEEPEETKAEEPAETKGEEPSETQKDEPVETKGEEPAETKEEEPAESKEEPSETQGEEPSEGGEEEVPGEEETVPEEALKDVEAVLPGGRFSEPGKSNNDELFNRYVESKFSTGSSAVLRKSKAAGSYFTGYYKLAYDQLKTQIAKAANGDKIDPSTTFHIDTDALGVKAASWTAKQLGVITVYKKNPTTGKYEIPDEAMAAFANKTVLNPVVRALLADCPYELYWYDKEKGVEYPDTLIGIRYINGEPALYFKDGMNVAFFVADEYACDTFRINSSKIERVNKSIANAKKIVSNANGKSDYEKLVYYSKAICDRVEYDKAAASDMTIPYGDPWQLVSVFDDDKNTNVVCEGYSKAFKYLCDQTSFEKSIECIVATGTSKFGTDTGGHMWNIVKMEDGKNYLVDVTNCDSGCVGYPDKLFLTGYLMGSATTSYTYRCGYSYLIEYVYDSTTRSTFSSELILSSTAYVPAKASGKCGTNLTWSITGNTLTISGTGDMQDYATDNVAPWDNYAQNITNVVISEGVTSIGDIAFFKFSAIKNIKLPQSLTKIGSYAFGGCQNLTSVKIPNGVKTIGDKAFSSCVNLTRVTIREDLHNGIDAEVFLHCSKAVFIDYLVAGDYELQITNPATNGTGTVNFIGMAKPTEAVVVPNVAEINGVFYKVTRIGADAFFQDKTIKTLTIGANVVIIDGNACYGCPELVKVYGGKGLKTIGANAFARCPKLSSFTIVASKLSKIGATAFYGDSKLKTLNIKKTTKLSKGGVKNSLKGSSVKTVKVKKSKVRKYKKYFKKSNSGRKVKVKK